MLSKIINNIKINLVEILLISNIKQVKTSQLIKENKLKQFKTKQIEINLKRTKTESVLLETLIYIILKIPKLYLLIKKITSDQ